MFIFYENHLSASNIDISSDEFRSLDKKFKCIIYKLKSHSRYILVIFAQSLSYILFIQSNNRFLQASFNVGIEHGDHDFLKKRLADNSFFILHYIFVGN